MIDIFFITTYISCLSKKKIIMYVIITFESFLKNVRRLVNKKNTI